MDSTKLRVNMDPSLLSVNNMDSCEPSAGPDIDNYGPKTKSAGIWSQDMSIKLIKEVEKRPILWDPLNHLYYNPTLKLDAWREVGRILGRPCRVCQNKVRLLTWAFRRERERMIKHYSSGKVNKKYTSKFFGFEHMKFLLTTVDSQKRKRQIELVTMPPANVEELVVKKPVIKYKPRVKKTEIQRLKSPEIAIKTELLEEDEKVPTCSSHSQKPTCLSNSQDPLRSSYLQEHTAKTNAAQHSKANEDSDAEIAAFTNFIAAKMKKYNATTRSLVQKEIGDILYRADQAQTRTFNFTL